MLASSVEAVEARRSASAPAPRAPRPPACYVKAQHITKRLSILQSEDHSYRLVHRRSEYRRRVTTHSVRTPTLPPDPHWRFRPEGVTTAVSPHAPLALVSQERSR